MHCHFICSSLLKYDGQVYRNYLEAGGIVSYLCWRVKAGPNGVIGWHSTCHSATSKAISFSLVTFSSMQLSGPLKDYLSQRCKHTRSFWLSGVWGVLGLIYSRPRPPSTMLPRTLSYSLRWSKTPWAQGHRVHRPLPNIREKSWCVSHATGLSTKEEKGFFFSGQSLGNLIWGEEWDFWVSSYYSCLPQSQSTSGMHTQPHIGSYVSGLRSQAHSDDLVQFFVPYNRVTKGFHCKHTL